MANPARNQLLMLTAVDHNSSNSLTALANSMPFKWLAGFQNTKQTNFTKNEDVFLCTTGGMSGRRIHCGGSEATSATCVKFALPAAIEYL